MSSTPYRRLAWSWRWLIRGIAATAIAGWPLLLLAAVEASNLDDAALASLAMLGLAAPMLALVLTPPVIASGQSQSVPPSVPLRSAVAAPHLRLVRTRRLPRIVTLEPCCHCGHLPKRPRRAPRLIKAPIRRPSLAVVIARADAQGQIVPRLRRRPRLVSSR